jgi:hypothetical protein
VIRVNVVVEGQTEESFVNNVLARVLWPRNIILSARLLGVPGHKGGRPNYARLKKDLLLSLRQDRTAFCSMMLDLVHEYEGLLFSDPEGFAGCIHQVRLADHFRQIRDDFPTPEDSFDRVLNLRGLLDS